MVTNIPDLQPITLPVVHVPVNFVIRAKYGREEASIIRKDVAQLPAAMMIELSCSTPSTRKVPLRQRTRETANAFAFGGRLPYGHDPIADVPS